MEKNFTGKSHTHIKNIYIYILIPYYSNLLAAKISQDFHFLSTVLQISDPKEHGPLRPPDVIPTIKASVFLGYT